MRERTSFNQPSNSRNISLIVSCQHLKTLSGSYFCITEMFLVSPPSRCHFSCTITQLLLLLVLSHFSRVRLCATPQMAAHQALLSLGFSRQEHWSVLPFPSPIIFFFGEVVLIFNLKKKKKMVFKHGAPGRETYRIQIHLRLCLQISDILLVPFSGKLSRHRVFIKCHASVLLSPWTAPVKSLIA